MGLVFAAIAPHGGLAVEEACRPREARLALKTRAGMEALGRVFDRAKPEVVVVATPHNVHIEGAFGVIVAGRVAGNLESTPKPVALDLPSHTGLAWGLLESLSVAALPVVGVSFGANDPESAVAPMDWGVLIPLWFMGGRSDPPVPVVVVTPARDLSASDHVKAGAAIAAAAKATGLRVAFIASADHGHAHRGDGPYGFDAAAKVYDDLVCSLVRRDRLADLVKVPPKLVDAAKADSWWQMLMLHGATGAGWKGKLLSYEAPTYFGMLTASYLPASRGGRRASGAPAEARTPRGQGPGGEAKKKPSRGISSRPRTRTPPRTRSR